MAENVSGIKARLLCVCMHVCGDQGQQLVSLPQSLSTLFLRQHLSLNLELTGLARLAGSKAPGTPCVCLPGAEVIGVCHHVQLFMWVLETLT